VIVASFFLAVAALLLWDKADGGEVRLAWDTNPEVNIFEYRLYRVEGTTRTLLASTPATLATVEALPGWVIGATAVNAVGLESLLSDTVVVPAPQVPPSYKTLDRLLTTASASSQEAAGEASRAIDGDSATYWESKWANQPPHHIALDLGAERRVAGIIYSPTKDNDPAGSISAYEIHTSQDALAWVSQATGTWFTDSADKQVTFTPVTARHIRLTAKTARYGCASELRALVDDTPTPPAMVSYELVGSVDLQAKETIHSFQRPVSQREFFWLRWTSPAGQPVTLPLNQSQPP